eukprot:6910021-Pyramimonas_sp.AAC.1
MGALGDFAECPFDVPGEFGLFIRSPESGDIAPELAGPRVGVGLGDSSCRRFGLTLAVYLT